MGMPIRPIGAYFPSLSMSMGHRYSISLRMVVCAHWNSSAPNPCPSSSFKPQARRFRGPAFSAYRNFPSRTRRHQDARFSKCELITYHNNCAATFGTAIGDITVSTHPPAMAKPLSRLHSTWNIQKHLRKQGQLHLGKINVLGSITSQHLFL
jgi:hypothetical protein